MTQHAVGRDVIGLHQIGYQLVERLNLRRRGSIDVEIADQANPNAVIVELIVWSFGMRAPFLDWPAGAGLDLTIPAVGAVADDEVISAAIPAFFFVLAI